MRVLQARRLRAGAARTAVVASASAEPGPTLRKPELVSKPVVREAPSEEHDAAAAKPSSSSATTAAPCDPKKALSWGRAARSEGTSVCLEGLLRQRQARLQPAQHAEYVGECKLEEAGLPYRTLSVHAEQAARSIAGGLAAECPSPCCCRRWRTAPVACLQSVIIGPEGLPCGCRGVQTHTACSAA